MGLINTTQLHQDITNTRHMQVSCKWTLALLLLFTTSIVQAQTLVMVRHAEKWEPWPAEDRLQPLSADGIRRAERLADLFVETRFKAVFASNTTRAISTALPSAGEHGLPVRLLAAAADADSLDAFMRLVESEFDPSDTVLIVSHSNIIPKWLRAFGVNASTITEMGISYDNRYGGYLVDGYNGMWVVNLSQTGGPPYVRFATTSAD